MPTKGAAVSVIVPVYNAEKTLVSCIGSVLHQPFEDIEVLAVDDGSTDQSLSLLREIAAQDGRVRVFAQDNSGVAAARNLALNHAVGTYVQFVDSDDLLAPDATGRMVEAMERRRCDLVIAPYTEVLGQLRQKRGFLDQDMILSQRQFLDRLSAHPNSFFYAVLWNKLYRRSIVEEGGLRCDPEVSWCEDFLFNLEYIRSVRLVAAVPRPLYYYIKRPGSLVSTQATLRKTIQTKRLTFNEYKEFYQQLDLYERRKVRVYRYLISSAVDGSVGPLGRPLSLPPKEKPPVRRKEKKQD